MSAKLHAIYERIDEAIPRELEIPKLSGEFIECFECHGRGEFEFNDPFQRVGRCGVCHGMKQVPLEFAEIAASEMEKVWKLIL